MKRNPHYSSIGNHDLHEKEGERKKKENKSVKERKIEVCLKYKSLIKNNAIGA